MFKEEQKMFSGLVNFRTKLVLHKQALRKELKEEGLKTKRSSELQNKIQRLSRAVMEVDWALDHVLKYGGEL